MTGLVSDFWKFDCGTTDISVLQTEDNLIQISNPGNGNFVIHYPFSFSKSKIIISDISGKIIFRTILDGNQFTEIELKNADNGIYFYSITSTNSVLKTGKLLIVK